MRVVACRHGPSRPAATRTAGRIAAIHQKDQMLPCFGGSRHPSRVSTLDTLRYWQSAHARVQYDSESRVGGPEPVPRAELSAHRKTSPGAKIGIDPPTISAGLA